jgi:large subunit ribosomal protein L2
MKVGDRILGRASKVTGNTTENSINNLSTAANIGKAIEIEKIPVGSIIYNVEIRPRQGGKIARAAGVYCEILKIENGKAVIRLPSKRIITISSSCIASLGRVSNRAHNLTVLGKAGVSR